MQSRGRESPISPYERRRDLDALSMPPALRVGDRVASKNEYVGECRSRMIATLSKGALRPPDEEPGRCYLGWSLTVLGAKRWAAARHRSHRDPIMMSWQIAIRGYVSLSRLARGKSSCMALRYRSPPQSTRCQSHVAAPGACGESGKNSGRGLRPQK